MAELSKEAQVVLDAYMNNYGWLDGPLEKDYRCTAAVLRAAVEIYAEEGNGEGPQWFLAIAVELEAL
jgi:hypothetical protein